MKIMKPEKPKFKIGDKISYMPYPIDSEERRSIKLPKNTEVIWDGYSFIYRFRIKQNETALAECEMELVTNLKKIAA